MGVEGLRHDSMIVKVSNHLRLLLDSGTVAWPEDLTAAVAWTDFHQNPPGLLGIWKAFLPAMTEVSEVLLWNHFCQTLGMGKLDSEICMLGGRERATFGIKKIPRSTWDTTITSHLEFHLQD